MPAVVVVVCFPNIKSIKQSIVTPFCLLRALWLELRITASWKRDVTTLALYILVSKYLLLVPNEAREEMAARFPFFPDDTLESEQTKLSNEENFSGKL